MQSCQELRSKSLRGPLNVYSCQLTNETYEKHEGYEPKRANKRAFLRLKQIFESEVIGPKEKDVRVYKSEELRVGTVNIVIDRRQNTAAF